MTPEACLEISSATITTPTGRPLFEGLDLRLVRGDHVALLGRNGVGKSTLLAVLARAEPRGARERGVAVRRGTLAFVPQNLDESAHNDAIASSSPQPRSGGELRRRALEVAVASGADILLLDEPTEDLDDYAVSWLRHELRHWPGCLVVVSHDRRLLEDFSRFFIASESGCRDFDGTLLELEAELERDHARADERYMANLRRLSAYEEHTLHIERRKARKKRYGRCRELDRVTPRMRLNQKRDHAQVSHGRLAQIRDERREALRAWSKSTRRALAVALPLEVSMPPMPAGPPKDVIVLQGVSLDCLFGPLDLRVARERVGVVGPNGAGKTTLLEVILGRRTDAVIDGEVRSDLSRIGAIAQGGSDWMLDESLLSRASTLGAFASGEEVARFIVTHRFPLALADRPLATLSPGERTRAALLCLFARRSPSVEVLVLDEPTYSLDLRGQLAITSALAAWPGGLVVASHNRAFLAAIGVDRYIELPQKNG